MRAAKLAGMLARLQPQFRGQPLQLFESAGDPGVSTASIGNRSAELRRTAGR